MTKIAIQYVPRQPGEPLAQHLFRNADVLKVSRGQRERLRRAAALSRGGRLDRADGEIIAATVRDELGEALVELMFTAQARGERVVDVRGEDGAILPCKRVADRDGLWLLVDSGALTEEQRNTALVYRDLYETAGHAFVGSQIANIGGASGARASTDGMVRDGLHRAKAGLMVSEADKAVGAEHRVVVLRAVAGEGRTIRSLYTGGRSRELATQRLAEDLDKVRVVFADLGGLRIVGH